MNKLFFLVCLIITSCTTEPICGVVDGGGYNNFTGQPYLIVDGQREIVDQKTYDSFFINDPICLN